MHANGIYFSFPWDTYQRPKRKPINISKSNHRISTNILQAKATPRVFTALEKWAKFSVLKAKEI
jgi:hypothetical protein